MAPVTIRANYPLLIIYPIAGPGNATGATGPGTGSKRILNLLKTGDMKANVFKDTLFNCQSVFLEIIFDACVEYYSLLTKGNYRG